MRLVSMGWPFALRETGRWDFTSARIVRSLRMSSSMGIFAPADAWASRSSRELHGLAGAQVADYGATPAQAVVRSGVCSMPMLACLPHIT